MAPDSPVSVWLNGDKQEAWRSFRESSRVLFTQLDRLMQLDAGIPQTWFAIRR